MTRCRSSRVHALNALTHVPPGCHLVTARIASHLGLTTRNEWIPSLAPQREARKHPIEAPNPIEASRSVMMDRDFGQSDLAHLLGSRSRASGILARKRRLSVEAIRRISRESGLPADVLVKLYEVASEPEAA